ncbi:protocadherin [Acrasis kona]|uniref:Protocadherin n=1 Tax=Acrasis kona TaxID=1008807 RepID=A0AAW2ZKL6_9EUKA
MSSDIRNILGLNIHDLSTSPRVWLVVPCLIPVVMGNSGGVGLTSIGLGGLLMSRGVEDLYFCNSSRDPYHKLLYSFGTITIAAGVINYGLGITNQENPGNHIVKKIKQVWRSSFGALGIIAGSFFILDGVLSTKPNLLPSNTITNIITNRHLYFDPEIIRDESLKTFANVCITMFQQLKIVGGSALIIASIQDTSRELGIRSTSYCYDNTLYYLKRFLGYVFPDDSYFGAVVCLFGAGTAFDGWRRLIQANHGVYDIIKNVEIAAGGTAIYYGQKIITKALNKDFSGYKDLPLASSYLGVSTTLFKYTLIDVMQNNPSFVKPVSMKNLVSSLLVMSLGYNGVLSLLKAAMGPFGQTGDDVCRKFTKHTANGVWAGISALSSIVSAQHTFDYFTKQPVTIENGIKSSLTCAAGLFCYYSAFDFLLGNRPSPDTFVKKLSRALVSSAAISGLVYFYKKVNIK